MTSRKKIPPKFGEPVRPWIESITPSIQNQIFMEKFGEDVISNPND
jgi:hypothetical protein